MIIFLLALLSCNQLQQSLGYCPSPKGGTHQSSLQFDLNITYAEKSKDSNSMNYKVQFDGTQLAYYGPYGECVRGNCPHKNIRLNLSQQEAESLLVIFKTHFLNQSYTERQPVAALGFTVDAHLRGSNGDTKTKLDVTGVTENWKTSQPNISKRGMEYITSLEKLQTIITTAAKRCMPTAH